MKEGGPPGSSFAPVVDRCLNCGSTDLEYAGYDELTGDLIEDWKCRTCGAGGGGANYWK